MSRQIPITITTWDHGHVGDGIGYSCRLSTRLIFDLRYIAIGIYWKHQYNEWWIYIGFLPCLALRFHFKRSYGGRFPKSERRRSGN